ncbi:hypothetical protein [Phytohabitans rumicis]|uniref:hypothetical protein n=1 Tax=Phytohabitans rumicis TaxID=1076125 RepID=UPI0031EAFAA1
MTFDGPSHAAPTLPRQAGSVPFFTHPAPMPAPAVLGDTTRWLCAAAYLDDDYAHHVITELTDDEQRAVPPSRGFDIGPVLGHAFRARRRLLTRDFVLGLILLAGVVLMPGITAAWLLFAFGRRQARDRRRPGRMVTALAAYAGTAVLLCCGWYATPLLFLMEMSLSLTGSQTGDALAASSWTGILVLITVLPAVFALLTLGTLVTYRYTTYQTLAKTLAPGQPAVPTPPPNERVGRRMSWLAGAQVGNVTLHSKNPLLGTGNIVNGWSMALTLRERASGSRGNGSHALPFDPRRISPQDLQALIRDRVLALKDPALPERQRVPGLYLMDQVVADGERAQGDPLLDPRLRTPLQFASPEAIASIIEHPQGGLRYFLHIVIGVEGRNVYAPSGALVLPEQQQEIMVSAFVHVAVEGGKLYAEFLGSVLPPVRHEFHLVDKLRPEALSLFGRAASESMRDWIDSIDAPRRLWRALRQILTIGYRADVSTRAVKELRSYEHGARLSVRELAAEPEPSTFLQELDATKYIKLVDKTVAEAIIDYLDSKGVDTSEYRTQLTFIQNHNAVFNQSTFNGPVAAGAGVTATQSSR